ncbi:hypothetical protein V2G26_005056 [Clonostachys chloroleuca]
MLFTKIFPLVFAALPMALGQNVPKSKIHAKKDFNGITFRIPRGWTMLGSYLSAHSTLSFRSITIAPGYHCLLYITSTENCFSGAWKDVRSSQKSVDYAGVRRVRCLATA